jgi:ABC-2 type transport system permease protein
MITARFLLRLHRRSIAGVGLLLVVLGALQASGYSTVAGDTPEERAAFAAQSAGLARQLSFLAPAPTELHTLGGYITWRVFGALPVFLGLWVLWFAVSALRGSEETNVAESLLSSGSSRRALVSGATLAFGVASASSACALAAGLAATSAGQLAREALVLQSVAVFGVLVFIFGLGSVAAQLGGSSRSAFAVGAAVLIGLNLINSMGSVSENLAGVRAAPLSWYSASAPLARGGDFSVPGTVALVVLGAVFLWAAVTAFEHRDVDGPLIVRSVSGRRQRKASSGTAFYRHPVVAGLYEQRLNLAYWTLGLLAQVAFFVGVAPGMVEALEGVPQLQQYLSTITGGNIQRGLISLLLVGTIQLVLALFAISSVARWAEEDLSGRLELDLSAPVTRTTIVVRRAATLATASALLSFAALFAMLGLSRLQGIEFGVGRTMLTAFLLVPFTVAFGAVGALWTSWRPSGAVAVLTGAAVVSYFVQEVTPLYGWPDWLLNVSLFRLFGNPLVGRVDAWRVTALALICVVGFVGASLLMRSRDIGT